MSSPERSDLLRRLDGTRQTMEDLLPRIDGSKCIYPRWTIKDMLAHMTGWDDATIDALRAHMAGHPPSLDAIRSLDEYNEHTVSSRADLDYDHVLKEWRLTRQVLRTLIEQMPEEKFIQPLRVPWGDTATVTFLVDIFRDHEEEHTHDILKWMEHPDHPLEKEGN